MTTENTLPDTSSSASSATTTATSSSAAAVPAAPSWAWRRGALILAGAAQLITISALVGADPLAATWSSLLLAIAPAPLAAVAAFSPAPASRFAAVVGAAVLVAGIVGQITHVGVLFLPALAVLIVATVKLWGEHS
jgi:hypothetical protein